jgi:methylated-DNA-[protein]-cysteine S-methyltransferase
MRHVFFYETDIGKIGIAEYKNRITNLYFSDKHISENMIVQETKLLKEAAEQLRNYLCGYHKAFDLPLEAAGTIFMRTVWETLQAIPYGETRSYSEVAKGLGREKAARAVGNANNRNPIPIFIPCHRVIGANGHLVGYLGGLKVKEYLLRLEKKYANI